MKNDVLYKSKNFTVKKSRIPGAGNGLFVNRTFFEGESLGQYTGRLITFEEGEKLEEKGIDCSHVLDIIAMKIKNYAYIYPKKSMLLGYINHAPITIEGHKVSANKRFNVVFEWSKKPPYVEIRAVRDIPEGSEVYLNYGAYFTKLFMKNEKAKRYFLK
jgi:uncharacterized protein